MNHGPQAETPGTIDLSSLPPEDAPTAAMAGFDNTISILFCARRPDQTTRFGATVRRDDLPANLGFAVAVEEAGHDVRQQLSVLPNGDVVDQDVNLVTGLMAAVAQRVWRAQNLTVDQIRSASIILLATKTRVSISNGRRTDGGF